MKAWLRGFWAVFEKDIKLELRARYAINMLLLFALGALVVMAFAVGPTPLSARVQAALLWTVLLFAAAVGLGRAFISEEERGTMLLLQLNLRPGAVYAGKLLVNFVLLLALNLVAVGAFAVLLRVQVAWPGLLALTLLLGSIGLAGATTLLSALIARAAGGRGALLPVLLFPVLVPLLLSAVEATRSALLVAEGWTAATDELLTLVGFGGAVITAAVLLFDYIWLD
ncbi:cytochrome c-type biogenesis protein CcmB [Rhodothermus marinus SG0.5JP17-172]|jgi:heme exporter protein B|uniref:heme exporter protein CcmB n=1 Tax=Rhodothermus marinus TaxID=29549 RepID=UPI000223DDBA|nr:heme exporter protein CcmB [Rhodothermus marinus]AEN74319.1 cytochrome c-type biogenesis protein CcmB [Rhodothermus marinus SG0.5JP17-172]MBO2490700.1 heme ABC transporter permease CcmB [Rhodothermus marinus]